MTLLSFFQIPYLSLLYNQCYQCATVALCLFMKTKVMIAEWKNKINTSAAHCLEGVFHSTVQRCERVIQNNLICLMVSKVNELGCRHN